MSNEIGSTTDATPAAATNQRIRGGTFAMAAFVAGIALTAAVLVLIGSLEAPSSVAPPNGGTRVDIGAINPEDYALIPHKGRLYYVVHRSPEMIRAAKALRLNEQESSSRTKDPEWLVLDAHSKLSVVVRYVPSGRFSGSDQGIIYSGDGISRDAVLFENQVHGGLWDLNGRLLLPPSGEDLRVPDYYFDDQGAVVITD